MKFQIDINIKKIVKGRLVYIYCDKPRALGEVLRHNHGIHSFAMTVWGHGVTLMPDNFSRVKGIFKGIEIVIEEEES